VSANGSQCSAITDTKNPTCGCTCNINFTLDVDFSVIKLNLVIMRDLDVLVHFSNL